MYIINTNSGWSYKKAYGKWAHGPNLTDPFLSSSHLFFCESREGNEGKSSLFQSRGMQEPILPAYFSVCGRFKMATEFLTLPA